MRRVIRLCAVLAALTWLSAPAWSQKTTPPAAWVCNSCKAAEGWDIDLELGAAWVGDDEFFFGDYTGFDDRGWYAPGSVLALYRDADGDFLDVEGFAYGPDALYFALEGGRQGRYEARASWQAIPRRLFDATVTPYTGNGTDTLVLPPQWVRAPNTAGMTALDGTAAPVRIGWDWDIYGVGIDFEPSSDWTLRVDYRRTEKTGQRRSSGSFGFSAVEFTQPVDYSSDDLEAEVSYDADTWQASLTYYGSVFKNDDAALRWDNPYTSGVGTDTGEIALAPDNEAHQVSLAASALLPLRTTLTGRLSFGRLTQDEELQAYTTNPGLVPGALPVTKAGAEADTWNVNLRAVSSPWRRITVQAEFRYDDFDNDTPVNQYEYVNSDILPGGVIENSPYDYERRDFRLSAEYRLSSSSVIDAGYDNERRLRNLQDRTRTTTDRLWAGFRSRIASVLNVRGEAFVESRGGSGYQVPVNNEAQQNPLMRKYNMADRDRAGFEVMASTFTNGGTSISFELEYSDDDYDDTAIGMTGFDYFAFGADLSAPIGAASSFYANYYDERIESDQAGSQGFSTPDWTATTEDRFQTATAGLTWPGLLGPVDVLVEYTWSAAVGEIRNDTSGLPGSFPDLESRRRTVRAGLAYAADDTWSIGLDYLHENLDTDDWSLKGVEPNLIGNLLALGADPWNYDTGIIYLSVNYRLKPR